MSVEREPAGAGRSRGTFGRSFKDFRAGDIHEPRPHRAMSEADDTWFALFAIGRHPLHVDAAPPARGRGPGGRG